MSNMRGQRSLFNDLLFIPKVKSTQRGRDTNLINDRNDLLLHRYYYYAKIKNQQYVKIMEALERETFITNSRIVVCLNENKEALKAIFTAMPTVKFLKEKFDWLVW